MSHTPEQEAENRRLASLTAGHKKAWDAFRRKIRNTEAISAEDATAIERIATAIARHIREQARPKGNDISGSIRLAQTWLNVSKYSQEHSALRQATSQSLTFCLESLVDLGQRAGASPQLIETILDIAEQAVLDPGLPTGSGRQNISITHGAERVDKQQLFLSLLGGLSDLIKPEPAYAKLSGRFESLVNSYPSWRSYFRSRQRAIRCAEMAIRDTHAPKTAGQSDKIGENRKQRTNTVRGRIGVDTLLSLTSADDVDVYLDLVFGEKEPLKTRQVIAVIGHIAEMPVLRGDLSRHETSILNCLAQIIPDNTDACHAMTSFLQLVGGSVLARCNVAPEVITQVANRLSTKRSGALKVLEEAIINIPDYQAAYRVGCNAAHSEQVCLDGARRLMEPVRYRDGDRKVMVIRAFSFEAWLNKQSQANQTLILQRLARPLSRLLLREIPHDQRTLALFRRVVAAAPDHALQTGLSQTELDVVASHALRAGAFKLLGLLNDKLPGDSAQALVSRLRKKLAVIPIG
jgi:hypothetical protein